MSAYDGIHPLLWTLFFFLAGVACASVLTGFMRGIHEAYRRQSAAAAGRVPWLLRFAERARAYAANEDFEGDVREHPSTSR